MSRTSQIATLSVKGVPRSQLPQLPHEEMGEFIRYLQTLGYPETRAPNPQGGKGTRLPQRGNDTDTEYRGNYYNVGLTSDVSATTAHIPVRFLKPTQKQLNIDKVKAMLRDIDKIKKSVFIVSKDNQFFDGHHRWAALMAWNKHYPIRVIRVGLPIKDLIYHAKKFEGSHSEGIFEIIKMSDLLQEVFEKRGINA